MQPEVTAFFDQATNTVSYVVKDPRLIIPSIQVNMRAGQMPAADSNGTVYLRLPVNRL